MVVVVGEGALLYVKNTLNCTQIELPADCKLKYLGVNVTLSEKMFSIVNCMYRNT